MEVLGDGNQAKSYLHVEDSVEAILKAYHAAADPIEVFNVGSEDQIRASRVAEIVIEEMGIDNVKLHLNGTDGGRGWPGDVRNMLLDITKLKSRGWKPRYRSEEAVRLTARSLLKDNLFGADTRP
jgi:UDP-glucose 4-epimerase